MANKFSDSNMSLKKKAKGIETRVSELEQMLGQLIQGIDQRFNNTAQTLGNLSEFVEALADEFGLETINAKVADSRLARAQAQAENEAKSVEEALADGYLTVADVIAEDSFIVGSETQADGKLLGAGRQQLAFETLQEQYRGELLGKGVGASVKTPSGGTFEVKEVYKLDKEKAKEVMEAKQKAAQEAAQAAAEKDEAAAPALEVPAAEQSEAKTE